VPELPDKYWNTLPAVPHVSLAQFTGPVGVTQLRDAVASLRDVYLGTLRVTRLYLVRSPLVKGVFGEPKRRAIPLGR
jgi:2'-5' RNA ligase